MEKKTVKNSGYYRTAGVINGVKMDMYLKHIFNIFLVQNEKRS